MVSEDSSPESAASWISSFCQEPQNQFFCEVERAFIEDGFNLYGLRPYVKHFKESLDIILDKGGGEVGEDEEEEEYQENAEMLYGLIHARYILTLHGMETMCQKFERKDFGECPRMLCDGQAVLPLGTRDEPHLDLVRIFCPKCQQVYNPPPVPGGMGGGIGLAGHGFGGGGGGGRRRARRGSRNSDSSSSSSSASSSSSSSSGGSNSHGSSGALRMDGAFIGSTFPHLFFMTFVDKVPAPAKEAYVPRVFGFRLSTESKARCAAPKLLPDPSPAAARRVAAAAAASGGAGGGGGGGGGGGAGAADEGKSHPAEKRKGPAVPMFSEEEGGGDDNNNNGAGSKRRRMGEG